MKRFCAHNVLKAAHPNSPFSFILIMVTVCIVLSQCVSETTADADIDLFDSLQIKFMLYIFMYQRIITVAKIQKVTDAFK